MYTATCTKTNADSAPGVIANRAAASRPAMPNVVRCMTASTYASTPTDQTIHPLRVTHPLWQTFAIVVVVR